MTSKLNKSIGIVFSVLFALVLVPASGWSQGYGTAQQTEETEVSSNEIEAFAKAQNQVAKTQQEYQPRYSEAEDQAEQQSIVEEMNRKMVAAVQGEGLSIERYNTISRVVQSDPALRQSVAEAMQRNQ
jgi:hypothetical protein